MEDVYNGIEDRIPSDLKGRYVDFQYVGQGGMGQIISAHDTSLDKRIAIKILPSISSDTAVIRFHQEAKAVSKLNHPNVVQVLDFGFASSGEPFLIMEFVKGETLDSFIEKNEKIPLRTIIDLVIQMCSGLEHAHANGIIHRDIKPGNIMLDEKKHVRILDFGLAKITSQTAVDWRLTKPGHAMGSPLYMSIEQLRGEEVDERSDIYSLGLVIYKMVTGRVPFEDENLMKIVMGRMEGAPPVLPPNEDFPLLTEALGSIIEVALQRAPGDRFAGMAEMKDALNRLEDVSDRKAVPDGIPNWLKTRVLTKQFLSIAAVILIASGIALTFLLSRNNQTSAPPPERGPEGDIKTSDGELTITLNKTPGLPEGFENQSGLWMAETRLEDADLKRLRGSDVQRLSLESNLSVTQEGIKIISALPIKALALRGTKLDDSIVPYLNQMKSLESLDLRATRVTDRGIEKFELMPNLSYLDLGYLGGVTDASMSSVKRAFPKLNSLILKDTKVTGNGLKMLQPTQFYDLIVSGLGLTDEDMDTIVSFRPERLTLEDNPITDKGLEKLKKLPKMEHLSVEFCKNVSREKLAELKEKFDNLSIRYPTQDTDEVVDGMNTLKEPEAF